MYPYPSGPAHMGHVRNYTFGDLLVRHRTMPGQAVLSPFGFDSFGLPAENAAIKTGTHPRIFTDARIAELKESIIVVGGRLRLAAGDPQPRPRVHEVEPGHLLEVAGGRPRLPGQRPRSTGAPAARRSWPTSRCCPTAPVSGRVTWWNKRDPRAVVPPDHRVCRRAAGRLDDLDWPERVKTMQRNWIGRSEGAEFDLVVEGTRRHRRPGPAGAPGLHHPAGHLVRHDLRGGRPRASPWWTS